MKNKNKSNYFIIERLDREEKADSFSNIYNLKALDTIKEVKPQNDSESEKYCHSIIKSEDAEKIRYGEKMIIIQAIKKAILSSNFCYNWGLKLHRYYLIFSQLMSLISAMIRIIIFLYRRRNTLSSIINKNDSFVSSNTTLNFNDSINTNNTNEFINNSYLSNETNLNLEEKIELFSKFSYFISPLFNNILMIPIWIIFFFKFIPQRDKINEIIYKFTRYLLVCESFENKKYYYHLMDDYSILVTKKDYFINNRDSSEINEKFSPEKNIFLYCINYINDYILEGYKQSIYYDLLPKIDKESIMLLREFIKVNIKEKSKRMIKRILVPAIILLYSTYFYNRTIFKYANILMSGLEYIKIIIEYFCDEYYDSNDKKLDLFIDIYNDNFLSKKKFIYRKGKLIMLLTLKDNNYDKNQVIKAIEKIINS